jgi:hypothetical protein
MSLYLDTLSSTLQEDMSLYLDTLSSTLQEDMSLYLESKRLKIYGLATEMFLNEKLNTKTYSHFNYMKKWQ